VFDGGIEAVADACYYGGVGALEEGLGETESDSLGGG
jgi:hypothetical protein